MRNFFDALRILMASLGIPTEAPVYTILCTSAYLQDVVKKPIEKVSIKQINISKLVICSNFVLDGVLS